MFGLDKLETFLVALAGLILALNGSLKIFSEFNIMKRDKEDSNQKNIEGFLKESLQEKKTQLQERDNEIEALENRVNVLDRTAEKRAAEIEMLRGQVDLLLSQLRKTTEHLSDK